MRLKDEVHLAVCALCFITRSDKRYRLCTRLGIDTEIGENECDDGGT